MSTSASPVKEVAHKPSPGAPVSDAPAAEMSPVSVHQRVEVPVDAAIADAVDWQRLWLAAQRSAWRSLALIPIGAGIETPRLAAVLAEVGRLHTSGIIVAWDATKVSLSTLKSELSALAESARAAERAIVALPQLTDNPACLEIARATDAVIFCVGLGESKTREAEQVAREVGPGKILGAAVIRRKKGHHGHQ